MDRSTWGGDHDVVFTKASRAGHGAVIAGDGLNDHQNGYLLSANGRFSITGDTFATAVGCAVQPGSSPCPHIANPTAIGRTVELELDSDGRLLLVDSDRTVIGVYVRQHHGCCQGQGLGLVPNLDAGRHGQ